MGVDLLFTSENATIYIPSLKNQIFRFNLEYGKFSSSLKNISLYHNTCSGKNSINNILIFGDNGGNIKLWDPRITKTFVSKLKGFLFCKTIHRNPVTSLRFDENNIYQVCVGFESGELVLFDLRTFKPLITKDMGNNLPIKSIRLNSYNNKILSCDSKTIKIWNKITGTTVNFFETREDINHVCKIKNAGLIFISSETPFIKSKYIETLGTLPDWCPKIKNEFLKKHTKEKLKLIVSNKKKTFFE
jgi:ribosome biogenesis protein ENP2